MRRRELGAQLRALRIEHRWTVERVAELLLVSPSKVSRLETGQRGASQRDIRDLCDLYGVTDERRQQLMDLAAEGNQRAWWQSGSLNYQTYVGLESEAASISDFGFSLVPGLLQTADYARAVLRSTRPAHSEEVIEQRIQGRLQRQRLLLASEPPKFQAVIDEAVLHRVPVDVRVMHAQLDRMVEVSEYPNVEIRVLPFDAGLLPPINNKFIILKFHRHAVPDTVYIEHLTGDVFLDRTEDVKAYEATFSLMRDAAATADQTRDMIRSFAATLGD